MSHLRCAIDVESEHRYATIGFVKFKGVDDFLGDARPATPWREHARSDDLGGQRAVEAESVTFLATDLDADGGKVILAAGVPVAREDDEGRLLPRPAPSSIPTNTLTVRIGVNRGHVFAVEIGTRFRATYTVMGDTVNLAARLMAAAGPGELLASPSVLDRSGDPNSKARALEPFSVKGKSEPVHAFALGAETANAARVEERRVAVPRARRRARRALRRRRSDARDQSSRDRDHG